MKTVINFLSGFTGWAWFEIFAAVLVAVGCVGEFSWLWKKRAPKGLSPADFEKKKEFWEKFFALVVALGVTMELIALPFALHETYQLADRVEKLRKANDAVDPAKRPLATASAFVQFQLPTNHSFNIKGKYQGAIMFRPRDQNIPGPVLDLVCSQLDFDELGMRVFGRFELQDGSRFGSLFFVTNVEEAAGEIMKGLDGFDLYVESSSLAAPVPNGFKITWGSAKLTMNSFLQSEYIIPDQVAWRGNIISGIDARIWTNGMPLRIPFAARK